MDLRRWIDSLSARAKPLARRRRAEADLDDELSFHLDMQTRAGEAQGLSRVEAERQARLGLQGLQQTKERARDTWALRWAGDVARDLQYAVRMLRKHPGFTTVAVFTLALGIGANTAVFTVVDHLLLRPPPFDHPERVYWIYDTNETRGFTVQNTVPPSPGNFVDWRSQTRSFDHMAAWRNWYFSIAGPQGTNLLPEQVRGVSVSPSFFAMLGVTPALGRTFQLDEEEPGRDHVLILSDGLWQRRFGGDPAIVGQTVRIDGQPFTIVGVLPSDFYFIQPDFELWRPLTVDDDVRTSRLSHSIEVLARLAPGVTMADAQADLSRVAHNLQQAYPATNAEWGAALRGVFPFNQVLRPTLWMLLAAVGCVLLIACINVANLLLVRGGVRQREIAIRTAVGASRGRLIRQLLTESSLLAGMGALAGVFVASWGLRLLAPLLPPVQRSGPLTLALDGRVLFFTGAVTVVTSLVFGLLPAWQSSRTDHLRVAGAPAQQAFMRRALSVVEIAASLMLLITATLLIKSLWNLERVDPGFRPERLVTMQMWLPETKYTTPSSITAFYQEILRRLGQSAELRGAALVNTRPFLGWSLGARVDVPGRPPSVDGDKGGASVRIISAGYLTTLGIPLLRGRAFTESDGPTQAGVVLVNERAMHQFWPSEDAIGRPVQVRSLQGSNEAPWSWTQTTESFTVVGVVGDTREEPWEGKSTDTVEPIIYLPYVQTVSRYMHVLVRPASTTRDVAALVQREIRAVDPDLGVYDVRAMDEVLNQSVAAPRLTALLLTVFASVALLLSAIGVYGVTSYGVTQRTREVAIRMAIGAHARSIVELVAREALIVSVIGVSIGLVGAVLLGRTLSGLLFGVIATDGWTLAGSATLVLLVAMLACWRPLWRATRVDVMTVLRAD